MSIICTVIAVFSVRSLLACTHFFFTNLTCTLYLAYTFGINIYAYLERQLTKHQFTVGYNNNRGRNTVMMRQCKLRLTFLISTRWQNFVASNTLVYTAWRHGVSIIHIMCATSTFFQDNRLAASCDVARPDHRLRLLLPCGRWRYHIISCDVSECVYWMCMLIMVIFNTKFRCMLIAMNFQTKN